MRELERAVAFQRTLNARLAERTERTRHGTARFVDSLPRVRWLNALDVDLGARATAEELARDAERAQAAAGLEHRRLVIDDRLGREVEADLQARGWTMERLLVMPFCGGGRDVDTSAVAEVAAAEVEPAWAMGIRSEGRDEETVRQLVAAQHLRRLAVDVTYFAARVDGGIASYCELFSDGATAQIESVMTLPEFRGRGLATAVVSAALAKARDANTLTFLVADDEDWPKDLYAKLGFAPVGTIWSFVLQPHVISARR
jgi:GNAT superfamily N-acetyltransferase